MPELGRGHRLTVTGRATLEPARIHKLAHNDRLETGVAHQSRSNRAAVISTELWQRAVRNGEKERIAEGDRL